ncbi:MAG: aminoacyl-histidine dipeptidase [Oligoflexales bacterium]|nr:aminoacyl-histidine dipeptidase [Oligoflexales bacterium]
MENVFEGLKPDIIWKNFEAICSIPHTSKNESQIINFMLDFGKKHNLETLKDGAGNILFRKPAKKGYENRKTVALQGHLDMVPQKNSDVKHDFLTDPIKPYIDGDWVKAKGTTLGADNGLGLAAAMAVLESKDLDHGPLEVLFTVDEETGMTGAFGLKADFLKSDIMINLDNEEEGHLCIGCAGGIDTNIKVPFEVEKYPDGHISYQLKLTGLSGGHSGCDIHLGRANAIKLIVRILCRLNQSFYLRLFSIEGGTLRNAIPREASATLAIPQSDESGFVMSFHEMSMILKEEFRKTDPNLFISLSPCNSPNHIISKNRSDSLLNALNACVNGVVRMNPDVPDAVQSSSNLGVLLTQEKYFDIRTLQRSSKEGAKINVAGMVKSCFQLIGAEIEQTGGYPGWELDVNSGVLALMKETYQKKFRKPALESLTHGGLECGLIGGLYPKMEMISFGPTIQFPHSPDEKLHIPSVEKFWIFLTEVLKKIPPR